MKRDKRLLIVAILANLLGNGFAVYSPPEWTILKIVALMIGLSGMLVCFLYPLRKAHRD